MKRNVVRRAAIAALAGLCLSLAACADTGRETLKAATEAYGAAWASRDVERILALHAEESEFLLHVEGSERAVGKEAIRAQFATIFRDNPAYAAVPTNVEFGDGFAIVQFTIRMDPPAPFQMGVHRITPSGTPYDIRAIDILHFKDGLLTSKHTYIDSEAVHRHSKARDAAAVAP